MVGPTLHAPHAVTLALLTQNDSKTSLWEFEGERHFLGSQCRIVNHKPAGCGNMLSKCSMLMGENRT